jgi:hypothetical protein
MHLPHYYPVDPNMDHRHREKGVEAGREAFPADDQAAVLALEPRERPLALEARDLLFHGAPTRLSVFPGAFPDLGPDPAAAELMAGILGIIPLICRDDFEPLAWSAPFARTDTKTIQQRDDLSPLVTIGGRRACGQRHTRRICQTVDEDAFTLPAMGDALTPALARGKMSRPRPHTATELSHALRLGRVGGLASRRGSRRPTSAAATNVPRSSKPTVARAGDRTSGSP